MQGGQCQGNMLKNKTSLPNNLSTKVNKTENSVAVKSALEEDRACITGRPLPDCQNTQKSRPFYTSKWTGLVTSMFTTMTSPQGRGLDSTDRHPELILTWLGGWRDRLCERMGFIQRKINAGPALLQHLGCGVSCLP